MEKEIDITKQYRTREEGYPALVYNTNGGGNYPVHGAVFKDGKWEIQQWTKSGKYLAFEDQSPLDLVEVKPRIKRTLWVNVYPDNVVEHETKEKADKIARKYDRLACVKIEIDCEEGEGL